MVKSYLKKISGLLCVITAMFLLLAVVKVEAGVPNEDNVTELIYGKWAVYGSSWAKYKFSDKNIQIRRVDSFDPYGESIIRVNMKSNQGEWNTRTTFKITYNQDKDKYELYITKMNPRGDRVETTDADYGKKYIKVYWKDEDER